MNWMEQLNQRAHLMGRMLETIGASESITDGSSSVKDLRAAAEKCANCTEADGCAEWLNQHADGSANPYDACPNAALFTRWASS